MGEGAAPARGAGVDREVVRMDDGAPIVVEGSDDHSVLVEDAGVLELSLVGVAERDGGRVDERGVRPDREEPKSARKRLMGCQWETLALFSVGRARRILATEWDRCSDSVESGRVRPGPWGFCATAGGGV